MLQKFRNKGWLIKLRVGVFRDLILTLHRDLAEEPQGRRALKEKTVRLEQLNGQMCLIQSEIQRLEAEIQMLTESPNSRDPLLLPETAGK